MPAGTSCSDLESLKCIVKFIHTKIKCARDDFPPPVRKRLVTGWFREERKHPRNLGRTKKTGEYFKSPLRVTIKAEVASVFFKIFSTFLCARKAQRSPTELNKNPLFSENVPTRHQLLAHLDPACPQLSFSSCSCCHASIVYVQQPQLLLTSSYSTGRATTSPTVPVCPCYAKFRSNQSYERNYIFTTITGARTVTSGRVV